MHSYFACQLARPVGPGDLMHQKLSKLLASAVDSGAMAVESKRRFYQTVVRSLLQELGSFELGLWDYWNEPEKVQPGFQDWVDGLQGKEARSLPDPEATPTSPRYMAIAMAFLVQQGSNSEATLEEACDIPDGQLWKRASFARILKQGVSALNFASVKSDVIYLLPQREDYALTQEDLMGSGNFDYLRRIE